MLWGVPKGSYASDPTGPCRIIEFRKMVQVRTFPCWILIVAENRLYLKFVVISWNPDTIF